MTDLDPETTAPVDWDSVPDGAKFLRRITFLDTTPDKPGTPPVHVTQSLLLDGVAHKELLDPRFGWQVFCLGIAETLVSFVANAEYVDMGEVVDRGEDGRAIISERSLCGIPVLTPPQEDHPWEVLPDAEVRAVQEAWKRTAPDRLTSPLYDVRGYKNYPYAKLAEPPRMIRVCVQVREVEVIAAPDPAQASIAQAIGEAVGEASMCWSEPPAGVFDSTRASDIVDRVVARLRRVAASPEPLS